MASWLEKDENVDISTFLKRDDIYNKEFNYKNKIGNINKNITILGMDNLGTRVIEKIKHLGYRNIECILLAEDIYSLEHSPADGKIFINKSKNIFECYEKIDYIVENSHIIIQIMDLGSNTSTMISDRINYQCKINGKKIAYICMNPLRIEGKIKLQSANKQKNELKNESILVIDSDEIFRKYKSPMDALDEMAKLTIEAIDYIIQLSNKYGNEENSTNIVVNSDGKQYNESYISVADELLKYKELLESGLLTREEFERIKNDLIK